MPLAFALIYPQEFVDEQIMWYRFLVRISTMRKLMYLMHLGWRTVVLFDKEKKKGRKRIAAICGGFCYFA